MYKILIVDDEEEVRTSIIKKMPWTELGFEVVGDAENGEEALEKIPLLEPDLLLTDIKMPYMDGLELAKRVKMERGSIEIVLFSGFDEFEYAKQAIKLDVIEYILKPVNVEELREILQNLKVRMDKKREETRDIQMLRENYRKTLPVLREYFLNELVHGELTRAEILSGFRRYHMDVEHAIGWCIVSMDIEIAAEGADEEYSFHKETELLPVSVRQMIDERMAEKYRYTVFLCGAAPRLQILFAFRHQKEIISLFHSMNQICYDCKRLLGLEITVGIGDAYEEVEQISLSYKESRDAIGYRAILGNHMPIYIKDVESVKEELLDFDERSEHELIQAIKFGSREEMESVIRKLVHKMEKAKVHSSQQQVYLISIFHSLTHLIQKYDLGTMDIWGGEKTYYGVLSRLVTAHSIKNFLINTCISLNENINREREDSIASTVTRAKHYIEENFTNTDLSVETVCDYLHISCAYFSTIFKKETGENYVTWLTNLRLNKAVELLSETDDKTYLIASQIGYSEPNYFSYVFKKKYGISPSKYRMKLREEYGQKDESLG